MKKIKILKKVLAPEIGHSLAWSQKDLYQLGDENKDFDFEVLIISSNGEVIENITIIIPSAVMNEWESDVEISNFILSNLNLENLGVAGRRVKINKEYSPKEAIKFTWSQTEPYSLDNKTLKNDSFDAFLYSADDTLVLKKELIVPYSILEQWSDDTIITNYILSQMGLQLDLDNTVDLVLAKLNEGTINFAEGVDAEVGLQILRNYATFVALQIESYKAGDISIDEINTIEAFATDKVVKITYLDEEFSLLAFVKELIGTEDKAPVLSGCMASITAAIEEEETQG